MAAALRSFARTVAVAGLKRNVELLRGNVAAAGLPLQTQVRGERSQASRPLDKVDFDNLPDFEISKDPSEWQYVERLLRSTNVVPKPKEFENKSPAGWTSPKEEAKKLPYFIPRTKNYMQPVYLSLSYRGMRHITLIRRIQGDIWQCEKDIRAFIQSKLTKTMFCNVAFRVNEMSCQIRIRGDHVSLVKYWMDQKGF